MSTDRVNSLELAKMCQVQYIFYITILLHNKRCIARSRASVRRSKTPKSGNRNESGRRAAALRSLILTLVAVATLVFVASGGIAAVVSLHKRLGVTLEKAPS